MATNPENEMTKTEAIAAARARINARLSPELAARFAEAGRLTDALRAKRGTLVGIAVEQGRFAVTETVTVGRKSTTVQLTPMQSYDECLQHMREMAAG